MKILVIIKQTFDTEAQIQLQDGRIQGEGVKKILNPYDEYAVEEAVQLKEKNGGEVIALGIGDAEFDGTLRHDGRGRFRAAGAASGGASSGERRGGIPEDRG